MRLRMLLHGLLLLLAAVAHAQQTTTTTTHPADAAALNAVFAKLGQKAGTSWNICGDPCTGTATHNTNINNNNVVNPAIKCELCTPGTGNISACRITKRS